jgi:hypothetical protein
MAPFGHTQRSNFESAGLRPMTCPRSRGPGTLAEGGDAVRRTYSSRVFFREAYMCRYGTYRKKVQRSLWSRNVYGWLRSTVLYNTIPNISNRLKLGGRFRVRLRHIGFSVRVGLRCIPCGVLILTSAAFVLVVLGLVLFCQSSLTRRGGQQHHI